MVACRKNYRLPAATVDQLDDLTRSPTAGTLTETAVVIRAVDELHARVCGGRRNADVKAVKLRTGKGGLKSLSGDDS